MAARGPKTGKRDTADGDALLASLLASGDAQPFGQHAAEQEHTSRGFDLDDHSGSDVIAARGDTTDDDMPELEPTEGQALSTPPRTPSRHSSGHSDGLSSEGSPGFPTPGSSTGSPTGAAGGAGKEVEKTELYTGFSEDEYDTDDEIPSGTTEPYTGFSESDTDEKESTASGDEADNETDDEDALLSDGSRIEEEKKAVTPVFVHNGDADDEAYDNSVGAGEAENDDLVPA